MWVHQPSTVLLLGDQDKKDFLSSRAMPSADGASLKTYYVLKYEIAIAGTVCEMSNKEVHKLPRPDLWQELISEGGQ